MSFSKRKHTSRLYATRHLLHRDQIRETVRLAPQPGLRNSALAGCQAALTAMVALPLIHLSPFSHLIGYASLGTLVALFGRFAPPSKRGGIVFACALLQTLMVFIMSAFAWAGAPLELQILLLAAACGFFFIVSTAGQFGPQGH